MKLSTEKLVHIDKTEWPTINCNAFYLYLTFFQRQGEKLKKTPTKLPQPEEKTSKKKISLKRKLKSDPMENIEGKNQSIN